MKNNKLATFVIIFICVVFLLQVQMCNHSKDEYQAEYSFVVSSIESL